MHICQLTPVETMVIQQKTHKYTVALIDISFLNSINCYQLQYAEAIAFKIQYEFVV